MGHPLRSDPMFAMMSQFVAMDRKVQGASMFCRVWNGFLKAKTGRARFYMSEADFQNHSNKYVSILRTDAWFRLGEPVQLKWAKPVDNTRGHRA